MPFIQFLSVEDVLFLQQNTIETEGGMPGLRDLGLLQSAVMMPQQQFDGQFLHPDLAAMAAAYLFHLTTNHPFLDGNKRVGALSLLTFLMANQVSHLPATRDLEKKTIAVAAGQMDKEELTVWLRKTIRKK